MASLYKQSIPHFTKYLRNLSHILKKSAQYADEKAMPHEQMLKYRLIADMRALTYQVQSCCDTTVWYVDRVGKQEHVAVADDEETFEQLHARIDRTVAYLDGIKPEVLDGAIDRPVRMETARMGNYHFETGQAYFSDYALPNFHFHLTSAYCILRTQGVPLNAMDYLKDVFHKVD